MKQTRQITIFVQSDASTENSNGVVKIIYNVVTRLPKTRVKFVVFGKPARRSIYKQMGEVLYLNFDQTRRSYTINKFLGIHADDIKKIISFNESPDRIVVFGSFLGLRTLRKFKKQKVRLCFIDSAARYYFKFEAASFAEMLLSKTVLLVSETLYELLAKLRNYPISYVSKKDRDFVRFGKNNCRVIENGVVPVETAKYKNKGKVSRLVFLGNLDYSPNRRAVEYIAQNLCDHLKGYEFSVIGAGDRYLAQRFGSIKNLEFTGYLPDLSQYLNDNSIFIAPIFSGTGLQNKVLDAFAHKVPVIASDYSVAGISCRAGVHYVQANTDVEFINAIGRLSEDFEYRHRLVKNAEALINTQYVWPSVVRQYEDFIFGK